MKIVLSPDMPIKKVQEEFEKSYPFLKLEFYRDGPSNTLSSGSRRGAILNNTVSLAGAGLRTEKKLDIEESMTVSELADEFREIAGLNVMISRKSGILWLETTMTNNWTLKRQNEHGRELSGGK